MSCVRPSCLPADDGKAQCWAAPLRTPPRLPLAWASLQGLSRKWDPTLPADCFSRSWTQAWTSPHRSTGPITTTNQLVYAPDGTKELKYLKQAPAITIDDVVESYRQAAAFHVCPLDYEVSVETATEIARLGKLMSVDLGGYGGAHVRRETYTKKQLSRAELMRLIRCFHVVKASDEDARLLFAGEGLSDEASAQRLVDWGAKVGIVTRGSKGSLVFTPNKKYEVPAISGLVVDVTGGGDSYIAGFWAKYLPTQDPEQAAVFASAVALCVIEKGGGVRAQRMPTTEEATRKITAACRTQLL